MKHLSTIINLALISIALLFSCIYFYSKKNNQEEKEEHVAFCGTIGSSFSEGAIQGKELFKMSCASCHNKNMNSHSTGPALKGFMNRWNNDTTLVYQYLTKGNAFENTAKNTRYNELINEDYYINYKHSSNLSELEFEQLLTYIEPF